MLPETVVGKVGYVTMPIKGSRPGEISVSIRGGTETFMAYTNDPSHLEKNVQVLVIGQRSARTVDVTRF
jgi:hypothetical protein